MLKRMSTFIGGLLTGLLTAGLLLLIIRPHATYPIELHPPPTLSPLQIHVTGAVQHPGVVQVSAGSIIEDAIQAAGGPLDEADLSRLNLAQELRSGQQVYVPSIQSNPPALDAPFEGPTPSFRLNINTADEVQLEQLPGVGPSLAANIVEYREAHGWFQEIEELLDVSGIGPAKLKQIEDLISFQ
jgi:competence protein ComEA